MKVIDILSDSSSIFMQEYPGKCAQPYVDPFLITPEKDLGLFGSFSIDNVGLPFFSGLQQ